MNDCHNAHHLIGLIFQMFFQVTVGFELKGIIQSNEFMNKDILIFAEEFNDINGNTSLIFLYLLL